MGGLYLVKMRALSLFSGIGGFDLGMERAGIEVVGMVENDKFCQKVLRKHWPNVKLLGDIRDVKGDEFGSVDIVCGGPPCQPASVAGKRRGKKDPRWLWQETYRIIKATKPEWIVLENVRGILSLEGGLVFENLLLELESYGYETRAFCIPACAINAPHRRDRVWIVANTRSIKSGRIPNLQRQTISEIGKDYSNASDSTSKRLEGTDEYQSAHTKHSRCNRNAEWDKNWIEVAQQFCRVATRVPAELDFIGELEVECKKKEKKQQRDRLKSLGNSIVPQIAEIIGNCIVLIDGTRK